MTRVKDPETVIDPEGRMMFINSDSDFYSDNDLDPEEDRELINNVLYANGRE